MEFECSVQLDPETTGPVNELLIHLSLILASRGQWNMFFDTSYRFDGLLRPMLIFKDITENVQLNHAQILHIRISALQQMCIRLTIFINVS